MKIESGYDYIKLVTESGSGGSCRHYPVPTITVRLDGTWLQTMAICYHEALEFHFSSLRCQFSPTQDLSRDQHNYVFVATHAQFSEAIARATEFAENSRKYLKRKWKSHHGTKTQTNG